MSKNDYWKREYGMVEVTSPKEPNWSRTYLPGYDIGDYLCPKQDATPTEIIIITKVTNTSEAYHSSGIRYDSDLVIHFNRVKEAELPEKLNPVQFRWFMYRSDTEMQYSHLLKNYRPLTDTELLLYTSEDAPKEKKTFTFNW